jgi:hypothetical protein
VAELARLEPNPEHVLTIIHGWDVPRYRDLAESRAITREVREAFRRRGERVAVLDLAWQSNAGPQRVWITRSVGHYFFRLFGLPGVVPLPYRQGVRMARAVGLRGARQMLLELQDRFPDARLHVLAHSLGSEITLRALDPDSLPVRKEETSLPYLPEKELHLDLVALAGADVNQDVAIHSHPTPRGLTPSLLWVTLPEAGRTRDKVLVLRKLARSKPALGDAGPRFRRGEIDNLIGKRRLVFDTREIPSSHDRLLYFNPARIGDLVDAAVSVRDPRKSPSSLLRELEQVLRAPADVRSLAQKLSSPEATVRLYALWRLEHLRCGNARHLEDGSSFKVAQLALQRPRELDRLRVDADCEVFKDGLWPTADLISQGRKNEEQEALLAPRGP